MLLFDELKILRLAVPVYQPDEINSRHQHRYIHSYFIAGIAVPKSGNLSAIVIMYIRTHPLRLTVVFNREN